MLCNVKGGGGHYAHLLGVPRLSPLRPAHPPLYEPDPPLRTQWVWQVLYNSVLKYRCPFLESKLRNSCHLFDPEGY
jgi:hypothetical protein